MLAESTATRPVVTTSSLSHMLQYRFPRYITTREDRRPEDASNPEVIVDLYNKQNRRMANAAELLANKNKAKPGVRAAEGTVSDQEDDDDDDAD